MTATTHRAPTRTRAPWRLNACPPKPAEIRGEHFIDANGRKCWVNLESEEEAVARVRANIAYYSHPLCPARGVKVGSLEGDLASGNLAWWEMTLAAMRDRGVTV